MARSLASLVIVLCVCQEGVAEPLTPAWSRSLKGARLVGVEEFGRCIVFADRTSIQIVSPANDVLWNWPYAKVGRFINPQDVAVSHQCDAIALVGDASYKQAWVAQRDGRLSTLQFAATPAEVAFDRTGKLIAIETFSGAIRLHDLNGELKWTRDTNAPIVQGIQFSDDNQRIRFNGWAGAGVVSIAGHVEWSRKSVSTPDADVVQVLPYYRWLIARADAGGRMWLRGEEAVDCVDEIGTVLASIRATPNARGVRVSRDFSQVLVVTEEDLRPVSVERYEIPAPCSVKN